MSDKGTSNLTGAEKKKLLLRYIEGIRGRKECYSFRLVGARLRQAEMPTARGWPDLLEKYKALPTDLPAMDDYLAVVQEIYADAVLHGRRAVYLFELPKEVVAAMAKRVESLLADENPYASAYPFPLSHSALARASHNGKFTEVVRDPGEDSVRIIACAKRSFKEREIISVGTLDEKAQDVFADYQELIGVKYGCLQAFDYVMLRPEAGAVEIHIDICCPLTTEDFDKARAYYCDLMSKAFKELLGEDGMPKPKNLFPYVQMFYDAEDGTVVRLGHATGTNSVKDERMRGRRNDLRKEPFHVKGLEEIKRTDSYAIRKSWAVSHGTHTPSIELPGHFSLAGSADAAIFHAVLDNCANAHDYRLLIGKLC